MSQDLCWMIGGPQGTGVDSSATLFARTCVEAGYWIYGRREYHSNIKGEHSYFQVRVKDEPVHSHIDPVHLLATFEASTAAYHAFEVVPDGALIYDPKVTQPEELDLAKTVLKIPVHFDEVLEKLSEETGKPVSALTIMKNTVAVGASCALLGIGIEPIQAALEGIFTGSKAKLVPLNVKAAQLGMEQVLTQKELIKNYPYHLAPPSNPPAKGSRLLLNGANAAALGKLKAGCRMQTYYSITPAVDECIFLEELSNEYGISVIQCEDELAAINMATGAATTGMRSSTSTSGPGFCLMAEGLGWAGINEVPVTVYLYQRGGPSTGLPTRNEQADLLFALFAGHGEFPKIMIAPGDVVEQFYDSFEVFNYADRYQTPVIFLSDKTIANNTESVNKLDESTLKIDRGQLVGPPEDYQEGDIQKAIDKFPRFQIKEDTPISPRPLPGTPGRIYWMTGDEHTEFGHITEKPEIRLPMHEKRMKKLELALKEIPAEAQYRLYGPKDAPITVVSWGSTKGVILDTMAALKAQHGLEANFLQIRLINPFPTEAVKDVLKRAKQTVIVENNYGSLMGQLITMRTGIEIPHQVLKWTGRPISETELTAALQEIHSQATRKVVLSYGL